MFTIHKTDTGAVAPFEYHEAAAGEYKIGAFLRENEGKLTNGENGAGSRYLCMAEKNNEDGGIIPVVRVNETMILKTQLGAELGEVNGVGYEMDVSNDGLTVNADGMGVAVEVVAFDGKAMGDTVYVRVK